MARALEILLIEDNPADADLTRETFAQGKLPHRLHVVGDGVPGLQFLRQEGAYAGVPRPDLILLDLNLPQLDGRGVLRELKSDGDLGKIPVVVLSSSTSTEDVEACYALHANSYVVKPVIFSEFVAIMSNLEEFWSKTVRLPRGD